MRSILFAVLVISISCASCAHSRKISSSSDSSAITSSAGGSPTSSEAKDGSSYEKAIFIEEKSETKGVHAEYEWIKKNYPGSKVTGQSLGYKDKKPYDVIHIETAAGDKKDIYFDISGFYGKW